jgi:hypothetical protein
MKSNWFLRPGIPHVKNVLASSRGRWNSCGIICSECGTHQRYYPQATVHHLLFKLAVLTYYYPEDDLVVLQL